MSRNLTAIFSNQLHADVCISNLKEADFKPSQILKNGQTIINVPTTIKSENAAKEIIQDHSPDQIITNLKGAND